MNIIDIIEKKSENGVLSRDELDFFITGYLTDKIKDYQASALLMAIKINGMNTQEIADLTEVMRVSGEVWDLSDIPGIKVDKHSTGGVGDKVSLVVGPIVASFDVPVAKMSGRGLGHTGGTLDKLEAIPGFNIFLNYQQFKKQLLAINFALIGQDKEINPADKSLYALRDVTGTVSSIPLIASSIMSKKLASGADSILLDVKYGTGAFMKSYDEALLLAKTMVDLGKALNKDVKAEITKMSEPLGYAVGNSLEVKEAIESLHGNGPKDFMKLCIDSSAEMLLSAHKFADFNVAREKVIENIKNGKAFEKFRQFVIAQGGDISYIDNPEKFEISKNIIEIKSKEDGYIEELDALTIGKASMHLGGGRESLSDVIDMSAGVLLNHKIGDYVKKGDLLCTLYTNKDHYDHIIDDVYSAYKFSEKEIIVDDSTHSVIK